LTGFIEAPYFTYIEATDNDDINFETCEYLKDASIYNLAGPSTWIDFDKDVLPYVDKPVCDFYNISYNDCDKLTLSKKIDELIALSF